MSVNTMKVAISLPKTIMIEMENLRHKLGLARSQAILEAVSLWLKEKKEESWDKKYARGYKKKPEESAEAHALMLAGLHSFSKDKW